MKWYDNKMLFHLIFKYEIIREMKNRHLRTIVIWGTVVLACLIVIQVYWFTRAFDVAEKQFDHSVQMVLKKVADSVSNKPEIKKLSATPKCQTGKIIQREQQQQKTHSVYIRSTQKSQKKFTEKSKYFPFS